MNRADPEAFAHFAACEALGSQECYPGVRPQKPGEAPVFPSIIFSPVGDRQHKSFDGGLTGHWEAISFDIASMSFPETIAIRERLSAALSPRLFGKAGETYEWDEEFRAHRRIVVYQVRF